MRVNLTYTHAKSHHYVGEYFLNKNILTPERSLRVRNHSPDGFSVGYCGSGCAQLALAILLELAEDKTYAERNYQKFKEKIIAALPQNKSFDVEIEIPSSYLGIIEKEPFLVDEDGPHIVSNINV